MKNLKRKFFIKLAEKASFSKEKMARYAYKNTAFYKKLYAHSMSGEAASFEELPLALKSTINDSSPFDLLSDKLKDSVFKYAETTGSTGSPTPSFFTPQEFGGSVKLTKLSPHLAFLDQIRKKNRRAVCGLACGFTIAGPSFQQILDHYGFVTANVDARTTIAPPERVARLLVRFKPSVIAAAETDFLAWMKVVEEDYPQDYQEVVDNLKCLLSTAELCSENRSLQISQRFDIIHIDNYACVEGYFSVPCLCGEKHIIPVYHTEVLSEDLTSTGEYGSGRFAFTNLIRKSTPLVRYLLDDYVTIYPSQCPFGFKKSIQPHGRYELTVEIEGNRFGTRHFEDCLFQDVLFGEYGISVYNHEIEVDAEVYDHSGPVDIDKIQKDFEKRFRLKTRVNLYHYGTIRNYREIRKSKPLLRLTDLRADSTQEVPQYL